jgi:coenzyme F420 hydrogenase subunit beta
MKVKLCSSCGLCMIKEWPAQENIQSCVFKNGWLGPQESDLFGRERSLDDTDEMSFGICKERFVGCIKNPVPGAAWTGVITSIAKRAFESGLVEGVATLHRGEEDFFAPKPVLARSTEAILASSGNKPVVSPILVSLHTAYEQGIKSLLVIGAGCHIHALRDFKKRFTYLNDMDLYVVGIPCVSNVTLKTLRTVLKMFSHSPETVHHYEFMQDFNVHLRHENGSIEKLPYFCLPREFTGINLVVPACMSCFDYINSLADITVGYAGALFNMKKLHQWIIVRTDKGRELHNLIADELETLPEETGGDCKKAVKNAARNIVDQMRPDKTSERKTGRKLPIWTGRALASVMRRMGPRGLEYARYGIDMHMIRDYYYVKFYYPELKETLVPKHVYRILEEYEFTP